MKLDVQNISITFEHKKILDNINLTLNDGELISLLGTSGAGKTTLFNIISGLLLPESGNVKLNGEDIIGKPGNISYMLQKDMLLPYKTVYENVALPLIIKKKLSKKQIKEKTLSYFSEFGIEGYENKYPAQLSGGMRQRAALLRTYLFSNEVALLDEPFSALDTITKSQMHDWYLNVMQHIKMSTIFITHDIDEAILLSDRIYIMATNPGRITDEIKITKSKPRDREFVLSKEFIDYKKDIISKIKI